MEIDLFMCIFRGDVKEYHRLVNKIKDIFRIDTHTT